MWFLLRGVTWPYFRKHWVITLLTLAGVSLAVTVKKACSTTRLKEPLALKLGMPSSVAVTLKTKITTASGVPENTPHWFGEIDGTLVLMSLHVPRSSGSASR